jgi:hypothetical protein
VPPIRVRLTAAKTGLGRHRELCLTQPWSSDSTSTSEDGVRLARHLSSDSALTLKDGLRLARPPGLGLYLDLGRRSPPRPIPGAQTLPRPRTTVSASPDPQGSDSTLTSDDGLCLARPPGLGLYLDLGRRSPPHPTPGPGLSFDLGGASASPDLGLGPTTSQGEPSLLYP